MLRSVASKVMRAGRAKVLLLGLAMMAAVLAASLLVLTVATKPAEAAFPGSNGAIAFGDGSQVYRMDSDGTDEINLTKNYSAEDSQPAFSPEGVVVLRRGRLRRLSSCLEDEGRCLGSGQPRQ